MRRILHRALRLVPAHRRLPLHSALCRAESVLEKRLSIWEGVGRDEQGACARLRVFGGRWTHQSFLEYLFGDRFELQSAGASCRWREALRRDDLADSIDIVLCAASPWNAALFERHGWFTPISWVDCVMCLETTAAEALRAASRTMQQEIRAAQRAGYRVEFSQNEADVEPFYTQMHAPTIQERHGALGILMPLEGMRILLRQGIMLKVYRDAEWVAGGIAVHRPNELWFSKLGWLQGDEQLRRANVVNLLYKGVLDHAEEAGYRRINYGACRGFADDGVLRYKMKWRLRPEIRQFQYNGETVWGPHKDFRAARFQLENPVVRRLLHAHPVVTHAKEGLRVITWEKSRPAIFDHLGDYLRWSDLSVSEGS